MMNKCDRIDCCYNDEDRNTYCTKTDNINNCKRHREIETSLEINDLGYFKLKPSDKPFGMVRTSHNNIPSLPLGEETGIAPTKICGSEDCLHYEPALDDHCGGFNNTVAQECMANEYKFYEHAMPSKVEEKLPRKVCDREDCNHSNLSAHNNCAFLGDVVQRCLHNDYKFFMDRIMPYPAEKSGTSEKKEIGSILKEAHDVINGPRRESYGDPVESFKGIAERWTHILYKRGVITKGTKLNAQDVALMMIEFKLERELNKPKRDNIRDVLGYGAIYADIMEGEDNE